MFALSITNIRALSFLLLSQRYTKYQYVVHSLTFLTLPPNSRVGRVMVCLVVAPVGAVLVRVTLLRATRRATYTNQSDDCYNDNSLEIVNKVFHFRVLQLSFVIGL